jgi:ATP-dependent Clp protease protease subunit
MNESKEFFNYAKNHLNIGDDSLKYHIDNGLTPYILEEREMRVTQMDIFSRLMRDRIIWVSGVVNQYMSDIIQAQLLFLDSVDPKKDITLHINSPGGSVLCGLGIVDLMNYISSDVATINIGMAASMGSVLLASGERGKRSSLIFSKVMVHQVSSGNSGHIQDNRISQMEAEKYNYMLFKMISDKCGRNFEDVLEGARRDRWLNSDEALEFGIIDEVIGLNKNKSITEMMAGFEQYYDKEILKRSIDPLKDIVK